MLIGTVAIIVGALVAWWGVKHPPTCTVPGCTEQVGYDQETCPLHGNRWYPTR